MSEPLERPAAPRRWRVALLFGAPLLILLVLAMLPLIRGTETLLLRDVLNSHFPMKWSQAVAIRHGYFPLLDPFRAGGQPLAGNLNAAPFYPDNLLVFLGSTFWSFNAHFWIHLLIAPFAFYWLGRAWGMSRQGSWAAAVCWTVSGFILSHLNFYNLIAGVSLAPALVAACLDAVRFPPRRIWLAPAVALLWTLMILGGDPQMALLAGLLALAGVALHWRRRPEGTGWSFFALLGAAVLCGTLISLPQIVEFLRIFPSSLRGYAGYSKSSITITSWEPRQAAEWLLPFLFGRPDVLGKGYFWGNKFFTGNPPYYLSLYPGLLALALVAASGRPRTRAAAWAWGAIGFGLFLSLGRYNPAADWLLVHTKSFRYPAKFWLPVAIGSALLCGLGFERLRAGDGRRTVRRTFAILAVAFAAFWAFLSFARGPAETWLASFIPRPAEFVANERLRWAGLALISLLVLAALGVALRISRRSWIAGGALLLAVHAATQLWLLRPLYPMDAVEPYLVPPPALAWVPADSPVVDPDYNYLFGPSTLRDGTFPEPHARWLERRSFYELYPFSGPLWGLRYELNSSPEGLDSYLARRAQSEVQFCRTNTDRMRMLAAWGVGRLLINHPMDPVPPHARLLTRVPSFGKELLIFEVTGRAPEAFLARRIFQEKDLAANYKRLKDPGFDPAADAVVFNDRPGVRTTAGGAARILRRGPESYEIETAAGPGGGLLVVQRSNLLYKATIDGQPAEVRTANAYRIGVEVPVGVHRVRLYVDRAPFHRSLAGALVGLLLVPGLGWWGRRS